MSERELATLLTPEAMMGVAKVELDIAAPQKLVLHPSLHPKRPGGLGLFVLHLQGHRKGTPAHLHFAQRIQGGPYP